MKTYNGELGLWPHGLNELEHWIFGFLEPNGSVKMMIKPPGLTKPASGSCQVFGLNDRWIFLHCTGTIWPLKNCKGAMGRIGG